jgi:hypothetical protein
MHTYARVNTHICACAHTHMRVCTHTYARVHTHICACAHTHMRMCTHTYARVHTHMHTHTHTHTPHHTHTHTPHHTHTHTHTHHTTHTHTHTHLYTAIGVSCDDSGCILREVTAEDSHLVFMAQGNNTLATCCIPYLNEETRVREYMSPELLVCGGLITHHSMCD